MTEAIATNRHFGGADVLNPIEVSSLNEFMADQYAERQVRRTDRVETTGPAVGQMLVPEAAQIDFVEQTEVAA